MNLETPEELADQIGDWVGCYGCCKAAEKGEDCYDPNPFCCRIGMNMWLADRIRQSVSNEKFLAQRDKMIEND